jgi:hypothetical protein
MRPETSRCATQSAAGVRAHELHRDVQLLAVALDAAGDEVAHVELTAGPLDIDVGTGAQHRRGRAGHHAGVVKAAEVGGEVHVDRLREVRRRRLTQVGERHDRKRTVLSERRADARFDGRAVEAPGQRCHHDDTGQPGRDPGPAQLRPRRQRRR